MTAVILLILGAFVLWLLFTGKIQALLEGVSSEFASSNPSKPVSRR